MATKVRLAHGERYLGQATLYDAAPSFYLLNIAFPDAHSITWSSRTNQFSIDVGGEPIVAYE